MTDFVTSVDYLNLSNSLFTNDNTTFDERISPSPYNDVLGPRYHRNIRMYSLFVMILISLVGNTFMCFHIKQKWRKRTRVHLLFINLALADILVTMFAMTSQLVWEFMDKEWIAGTVFCRIFKVLQTFTMVSSNYLLVSIALDRHVAIVYPLARNPRTKTFITLAWASSLIPSLPNAYIFQVVVIPPNKTLCLAKFYTSSLSLLHRQIYMTFIFLAVFILPIFIILGLYSRILYVIWTRSKHLWGSVKSTDYEMSIKSQNSGPNAQIPRAKVKTLKMTLTVVMTFLATCLPYLIQEMIIAFGNQSILNENVVAMSGIISASNSAINPYIYLLFNSKAQLAKKITNNICSFLLPFLPRHGNSAEVNSTM